jgi:hypothetical protein
MDIPLRHSLTKGDINVHELLASLFIHNIHLKLSIITLIYLLYGGKKKTVVIGKSYFLSETVGNSVNIEISSHVLFCHAYCDNPR